MDDMLNEETKLCPECAETIKLKAKKCRYCQSQLDPEEVDRQVENRRAELLAEKKEGKIQCPFCAENIEKETIECKHCGEILKPYMIDSKEEHLSSKNENKFDDRNPCLDESCIGTIDSEGMCSECGRTMDEVSIGVKSKAFAYRVSGTVPKTLIKRFQMTGRIALLGVLLTVFGGMIISNFKTMGFLTDILLGIIPLVTFISYVAFLFNVANLSAKLGKSPVLWVGGCIILHLFFALYAYYKLPALAIGKEVD